MRNLWYWLYSKIQLWLMARDLRKFLAKNSVKTFEDYLASRGFNCYRLPDQRVWRKGKTTIRITEHQVPPPNA